MSLEIVSLNVCQTLKQVHGDLQQITVFLIDTVNNISYLLAQQRV